MINYKDYIKILEKHNVPIGYLADSIYSKGQEKLTSELTERLGEIMSEIEQGGSTTILNNFTREKLDIENPVLRRRDFRKWESN